MNAKTIQKYKKSSTANLKLTAIRYFNRFIRLRDTDENGVGFDIGTGQILRYGSENTHAGHFYAAGSFESLRFNENNVNLQSKSENYYKHGGLIQYQNNLIEKIGVEAVKELEFLSKVYKRNTYKVDRFTLIDTIETYKAKCKELAKTKNFQVK